jgi:hypothetical protein
VRGGRLSALAGGDVGESTWDKESGQGWPASCEAEVDDGAEQGRR